MDSKGIQKLADTTKPAVAVTPPQSAEEASAFMRDGGFYKKPKNVVLCCDGTANEFAQDRTNVVKLFYTLVHRPSEQVAYYHPGVGTMEPPGALTTFTRSATKLAGLAFGYGLESDIRDAYVFLMNHYEDGDSVFMFGFSRGAYTVRAVAALLHMYGLIRKGNESLVLYAIRMMMAINKAEEKAPARSAKFKSRIDNYFGLARQFKDHFCKPSRLHFVGVWDTVSSVGWIENPVKLPHTANNPDIHIGRHAIAIDERRAFFRTNLWRPRPPYPGPKDLKQVWFAGVHCDVGGGYPEVDSGASKYALEWMLVEAKGAGLLLEDPRVLLVLGRSGQGYAAPNPKAILHESLTTPWWPAEFVLKRHYNWDNNREERRMNLFRRRTVPDDSRVHESVYLRGPGYYQSRLPAKTVCEKHVFYY